MGKNSFLPYLSVRCDFQSSNPNDKVGLSLYVRARVCVCARACVRVCVIEKEYLCMDLSKFMLYICIYTCDYMEYNPTYV